MRQIGQNGLDLTKHCEGVVFRVYLDSSGFATAGVGHLMTAADEPYAVGQPVTDEQVNQWLQRDLGAARAAVDGCGLDLAQNQFDALVDFAFNEGAGNLQQLVEGAHRDLPTIAEHFSHYTRSGHDHPRGLAIRRALERDLFLAPEGPMPVGWLDVHNSLTVPQST